ncbi:MAG: hypothetical protein Q8L48_38365 [Archangium sp.]|nr:hypothetical protein [Archangium sp.]
MLALLCVTVLLGAAPGTPPIPGARGAHGASSGADHGPPRAVVSQGLGSVSTLAPWLSSPVAFRDAKNRAAISHALHTLANLRHPFFREPGSSSTGVGELFGRQAARAQADFASGHTESARFRVQALTQLCLGCHLREPSRDFVDAAKVVEGLQLTALQRAHYYATMRQFDLALGVWAVELARPVKLESEQFEQLEALRLALRVAVRVKDSAPLAQRLIAPQLERAGLPGFALRELQSWQAAAEGWEAEHFVLSERTPAALVARAASLVKATEAQTHVAAMPEHFLSLLRAASYLDEAMRQDPEGPGRGQALYLLGVVHASISESPLWQLEWMYFEACIRENAGLPLARACGERLQDRTWFIWRTGADMPASTAGALKELLVLAKVSSN